MKINKLRYHNCAGIEELEVIPGSVTVFTGKNGSGKSSSLKGLRSLFPSSNRINFGTLLPDDAEEGSVVAWLDDGMKVTRELYHSDTAAGSPLSLERGKWKAKGQNAFDHLAGSIDAMSVNAEKFLFADGKERLKVLLEAMPFTLDEEKFRAQLPETMKDVVIMPDQHPLETIEEIRKRVYSDRADANKSAKEKGATAKQMTEGFPAPIPTDEIDHRIRETESSRDFLEESKLGKLDQARIAKDGAIQSATFHRDTSKTSKRSTIQAQIDALISERTVFEAEQDRVFELVRTSAETSYSEAMTQAEFEFGDKIEATKTELIELRKTRDTELTYQNTRRIATQFEREAEELAAVGAYLSERLDAIDQFKVDLLKDLPIKGVEIKDGEVYIDGLPWSQNAESRIVKLAVDVACAKAGDSGIVVIDRLEALDDNSFQTFLKEIEGTNRQIFCARASTGDFRVETYPQEA